MGEYKYQIKSARSEYIYKGTSLTMGGRE